MIVLLIVMNNKVFITLKNLTLYNDTSLDIKKYFMENKIPPSAYS